MRPWCPPYYICTSCESIPFCGSSLPRLNFHGNGHSRTGSLLLCPGQNPVWVCLIGWAPPELANRSVKWSWTYHQMGSSTVTLWTVEPNQHVGRWSVNKWGHAEMCQVLHIVDRSGGKLRFNTPVRWLSGHRLQGNVWTRLLHDRPRLACNCNVLDRQTQFEVRTPILVCWLQSHSISESVPVWCFLQ